MVSLDLTDVQAAESRERPDADHASSASSASAIHQALFFDWDGDDLELLRLMMTRKGVDLETAAQVFFNGTPERFNMIAKADLPIAAQARCNLLDSIHRRIVCGFYLPDPERGLGLARASMQHWINRQDMDGAAGRSGRWVFDREVLDLQMTGPGRAIIRPRSEDLVAAPPLWERLTRIVRRDKHAMQPSDLPD